MRGQRGAVFNHLKAHGYITSWEAIEEYGCTRLAAVICDLRKMGYNIATEEIRARNRYGEPTKYARYVIAGKEDSNGEGH